MTREEFIGKATEALKRHAGFFERYDEAFARAHAEAALDAVGAWAMREALEAILESPAEMEDSRVGYAIRQVNVSDWKAAQAAVAKAEGR